MHTPEDRRFEDRRGYAPLRLAEHGWHVRHERTTEKYGQPNRQLGQAHEDRVEDAAPDDNRPPEI